MRYDDAITSFDLAVKIDLNYINAHNGKGDALI
jgi:hypothetical protein